MSDEELEKLEAQSPVARKSSSTASVDRASSLQAFETAPEYTCSHRSRQIFSNALSRYCISVLNSIGGSAVLLLAFAVTCISRYIPPSSCIYGNGRQAVPTEPLPFPIERLNGRSSASFPTCTDKREQDAYIVFAVAAALCGYIASLHGVCMYTLVVNYVSDRQKHAFIKRVQGTFVFGVLVFFLGVLFLFLALAFNCYGIQVSRLVVSAVNSTTTNWKFDDTASDAPFYICIVVSVILLYGIVRLRQAVILGNAKVLEQSDSISADEVVQGAREFELAVARSTAASSDANIVCGYILYNIVTFGTDVASLSSDSDQVPYQLAFLLVNVLACAFALISVVWGLFINVWSSVSDSNVFRYYFILRAKPITKLAYYMFLLSLNLIIVTMAMFGKAKFPTPEATGAADIVPNPAPLTRDDKTIAYKEL